jgi:predicted PurR-regulated permease PerM
MMTTEAPIMKPSRRSSDEQAFLRRTVEATIRIGLIGLLAAYCFHIISPFLGPVVWGAVIAVAAHPMHRHLSSLLGSRPRSAAALFVVGALVLLMGPTALLSGTLVDTAHGIVAQLGADGIAIPPPPARVAGVPVIGERLFAFWSLAAENFEAALEQVAPQVQVVGTWLLSTAAGAGFVVVEFVLAIIIAGVLLAHDEGAARAAHAISARLTDDRGMELVALASSTIRSVATGVLGVAVIQSLGAGIGMLAVGVPGAGLWALLVLIVAVLQLPTLLILGPVVAYVFSTASTTVAVLFLVWSVIVGVSDTFMKPIFLGRGVDVPMIVIFLGAIGGLIAQGILGLFIGAVVLALGYKLFVAWLADGADEGAGATGPGS